MRCPDCDFKVPDNLSLCPQCGLNIEATQPVKRRKPKKTDMALDETIPIPLPQPPQKKTKPERPSLWRRALVVIMAFLAFIILLVVAGTVGVYTGIRRGEVDQTATADAIVQTASDEHYRRGIEYLDAGSFELAISEFERALEINPAHPLAPQGLDEARARLAAIPTPTIEATIDIAAELYAEGTSAYGSADWETAIRALSQLRAFAPGYERELVEDMLFRSLSTYGLEMLSQDNLEEGIFYLDQANEIQPLSDEILWERNVANLYLIAIGYWGVDWERCAERFQDLYALAPGYRDVAFRLFQAHVEHGDLWAEEGEMCPAAEQYALALELVEDVEVTQKYQDADGVCAQATPTPIPPITGTLALVEPFPVPGFQGRLAYSINEEIYVLAGDGESALLAQVATSADQPSWRWNSDVLAYRNRPDQGISVAQVGSAGTALPASPGAAWPTLSADGSRYSFAARDENNIWHVYIAPIDGSDPPIILAQGWGPSWSPNGLLAWTGCEANGTTCGIFIDNPDNEEPPRRYTASPNDSAIHWHPNGEVLAYMSDHSGNWDIYMLNVNGGIQGLLNADTLEALPAWSPDGNSLAFLSYRDGNWGIYMMQIDGTNVREIIDLGTETPANWQNQRISWTW